MNRYEHDAQGNLLHYINEELRATVPAAHIEEYRKTYPDAPSASLPGLEPNAE